MGRKYKYNNKWIFEHYDPDGNWHTVLAEYNKTFGTDIKYPTFVSHMNRELKLQNDRHIYTEEQDQFLREKYPVFGAIVTTEMFNNEFGTKRTPKAIAGRCKVLNLHVTPERKSKSCPENHKRSRKEGTIVYWGLHGQPMIKTKNGWRYLKDLSFGQKDPNKIIIHLDGNRQNVDKENLMQVSRRTLGMMLANDFWSENPEITKSGILCCELEDLLTKEEYCDGQGEGYQRAD